MSKGNRTKGPRAGRPKLPKSQLGIPTTIRLAPVTKGQIAQLAKRWDIDKTATVERAVNEAYGREVFGPLYVSPKDPRHPKHAINGTRASASTEATRAPGKST